LASSTCWRTDVTAPPDTHAPTLSLHDALPISGGTSRRCFSRRNSITPKPSPTSSSVCETPAEPSIFTVLPTHGSVTSAMISGRRSEEHTSELQSRENLVCRLLLEKKKESRESM